jgi:diacylglycerol kinase (ATP)
VGNLSPSQAVSSGSIFGVCGTRAGASLVARGPVAGGGGQPEQRRNRAIDVGRVIIDDRARRQVFLVMAGMGFDAAIMTGASHGLKARLGPLAYFVSGVRALKDSRARITVAVDGRPELCCRVRTVVVGNCGKLLAGLVTRRRRGHRIVRHWQGSTVTISAETPQQAQLDGDPVGEVRVLRMYVDRGALPVRS